MTIVNSIKMIGGPTERGRNYVIVSLRLLKSLLRKLRNSDFVSFVRLDFFRFFLFSFWLSHVSLSLMFLWAFTVRISEIYSKIMVIKHSTRMLAFDNLIDDRNLRDFKKCSKTCKIDTNWLTKMALFFYYVLAYKRGMDAPARVKQTA